ncbi:ribosomal protein S7 domain-containing protein [Nemania sp. FL0916]|nr:ribosomal protein S7 domain-containing protein [Nemania sp. FL0916]
MASKINPWRSLRSLAIRTRPHHPGPATTSTTMHLNLARGKRGLTDDTSTYPPSSDGQPPLPPSIPQDYTPMPKAPFADNYLNAQAIAALEQAASGEDALLAAEGLKFDMPPRPKKHEQLQDRDHPVIHQLTRMLMQDGKLSKAQKHVSLLLNYLRTNPAPKVSPLRPLLPGAPPAKQLPLNPILYLTMAIDSVAPVVRIRSLRGMAGGGQALDLPQPMQVRARRRQAISWILDVVAKKRTNGSGPTQFATRLGQEIVAVVEGKSSVWDRRQLQHKAGTAARANLSHPALRKKR